MKPVTLVGTVIVQLALLSYGIGVVCEQRKHRVTGPVLAFLGFGLACDLAATACMIVGSGRGFISVHGLIGYTCLLAMGVDFGLILRHRRKLGDAIVPRALHLYSRYAYLAWVLGAYVTGGLLAYLRIKSRQLGL